MKRSILSILLVGAVLMGGQVLAQVGRGMVAPGENADPGTTGTAAKTSALFDREIVIDYLGAENHPKGKPNTWARSIGKPDKVLTNMFEFGTMVTASDDPTVLIRFEGPAMLFKKFVQIDSSLFMIPDSFTVENVTFYTQFVMNRTDGEFDSLIVRLYPFKLDASQGFLDTLPDNSMLLKKGSYLFTQGQYPALLYGNSWYLREKAVQVDMNYKMTPDVNSNLGFWVNSSFFGAKNDTMGMMAYSYIKYDPANAPALQNPFPDPNTFADTTLEQTHYPYSFLLRGIFHAADTTQYNADAIPATIGTHNVVQQFHITAKVGWDTVKKVGVPERFDGTMTVDEIMPNPVSASASAKLNYKVGAVQDVNVTVYNTLGQQVRAYNHSNLQPGHYTQDIATDNLKPGIYFVRVQSPGIQKTQRLVVY